MTIRSSVEEALFTRTNCRCCSAVCGIIVETRGDRVIAVRGDSDNPRSRGYLCPKGASLSYFHNNPENLLHPRVDGVERDWATTLDDLGARLRTLIEAHGKDAVGIYLGNGTLTDTVGARHVGKLTAAIGTSQYYSALTVDCAPMFRAAEMVAGSSELRAMWVPEEPASRLAIFLGANPPVSHGYGTILPNPVARIAAFRKRGGRIWAVDPRKSRMAALADAHLQLRPGSDVVLLAWLVRELLLEGADRDYLAETANAADVDRLVAALASFDLSAVAKITGVSPSELLPLLDDIRASGRISVISGTGLNFGPHALLAEWLRLTLLIVTGSLDRKGGMWFNPGWIEALEQRSKWPETPPEGFVGPGPQSRPDLIRFFGQNPCSGLVDEIEAGHIRALVLVGGSLLTSIPDPERMERALRQLDMLATIDILDTSIAKFATHVLPATGQLERTDILVETRTMLARSVVPPLGQRRPMWWILAGIARRLGLDILEGDDPDVMTDESMIRKLVANSRDGADALFAAGADGLMPPRLYGWVTETVLRDGRWRLTPPGLAERLPSLIDTLLADVADSSLRMVCGRQLTRVNAISYVPPRKVRDLPEVHVHPGDASARGFADGEKVMVRTRHGEVKAVLTIDPEMRPGAIWITHGFYDPNVGCLTSGAGEMDALVGQPQMTALAVHLERAA